MPICPCWSQESSGGNVWLMPNAIKMLQDDHNSARILFGQIQQVPAGQADAEEKATLQIAALLRAHTTLEEEFIYPLVAEHDRALADAYQADHDEAERLIGQIEDLPTGLALRDVMVQLQDAVKAHVDQEEESLFPLLAAKLDVVQLEDLGSLMMTRQQELLQEGEDTAGAAETAGPPGVHPLI